MIKKRTWSQVILKSFFVYLFDERLICASSRWKQTKISFHVKTCALIVFLELVTQFGLDNLSACYEISGRISRNYRLITRHRLISRVMKFVLPRKYFGCEYRSLHRVWLESWGKGGPRGELHKNYFWSTNTSAWICEVASYRLGLSIISFEISEFLNFLQVSRLEYLKVCSFVSVYFVLFFLAGFLRKHIIRFGISVEMMELI